MCRVMTFNALAATFLKLIHLCIPVDRKYLLAPRYLLEVKSYAQPLPPTAELFHLLQGGDNHAYTMCLCFPKWNKFKRDSETSRKNNSSAFEAVYYFFCCPFIHC
jgi:hypothetical protein